MEHAFFHPSSGRVWIAIETPSAEILATYPEGTVEIPLPPGPDHQWSGEAWVHVPPPPAPDPVPSPVSALQARLALKRAGLLPAVEAAVMAADDEVQMAWAHAIEWNRNSPTILTLADALGLTSAQVDGLFRTAAGIEV